jgi:hypothetical protein
MSSSFCQNRSAHQTIMQAETELLMMVSNRTPVPIHKTPV